MNDVKLYHAVTECRRLYGAGLSLPAAAADAAEKFDLHPLRVSTEAARAIEACREARGESENAPL